MPPSKAEYIRAHPNLPPFELVKLAASEGITLQHNRILRVRRMVEKAKKGLCQDEVSCMAKVAPGRTLCPEHLKKNKDEIRRIRADRKAKGLCWRCGEPARPGGLLCDKHRIQVTVQERRQGKVIHPKALQDCRICGRKTFARHCPEHWKAGLVLEARARSTKHPSCYGNCPRCGLYGHNVQQCVNPTVLVSYLKILRDVALDRVGMVHVDDGRLPAHISGQDRRDNQALGARAVGLHDPHPFKPSLASRSARASRTKTSKTTSALP